MFKFIILTIFLLTGYANIADTANVYDLVLTNNKFSVNFDYDKIILETTNKKYHANPIINYQHMFEDIYETESEIKHFTEPISNIKYYLIILYIQPIILNHRLNLITQILILKLNIK
jgi:hypothetical protein